MTFKGSAPLVSPSELTYFPGGSQPGFTWNVAGGELTFSGPVAGSVFTVNASGPETDNVYVGFSVGDVTGGFTELLVGFGLDSTHYICASPAGSGGTYSTFDVFVNNGGVTGTFGGSVSPPVPYDTSTSFLTFYLALSGTLATVYAINQTTGLTANLGTVNVSSVVDAPTLQTWSAAMRVVGSGTGIIKNVLWGPNSDLAPVIVPSVVTLMQTPAEAAIVAANLIVGTITSLPNAAPAGTVTAQSPIAGIQVLFGTPVNITVSSGQPPTTVPDLVNTSLSPVAPDLLAAADLVLGVVTYASSVLINAGNIISQSPVAGSVVNSGSSVDVLVSTGREGVVVPNLEGLTQAEAITAIVSVGLLVNVISTAPSTIVQSGLVMAQNPTAGAVVASGSFVGFVVSSGAPVVGELFDFEATVISQYANSPTILQLVEDINAYIDQTANFAAFYAFVWNVDTAQGFGLDIWGKIVNVSRLLQIPTTARYVGFQNSSGPPAWDEEPFSAAGTFFTGQNATQSYLLDDESYRRLILTKAFANIVNTTAPAINQILQRLFPGRGNPYVANNGGMSITYTFDFDLTPIELAILQQSTAVPSPVGVSVSISVP